MSKKHVINDIILWIILIIIVSLFSKAWHDMHMPFDLNHINTHLFLNLDLLPYYTLRTTMRLLLGLLVAFIFTLIFGTLAAKYKTLERVILPFVNFMESIPLVGFLAFTTLFFIGIYPHNTMGLEYAAIFGVFTGQVWNMILIFYQTLTIVPKDLIESGKVFHHNPWQIFWKIEAPFSMPGLLWNIMVSQSAAWFAILATEAIPIKIGTFQLPGIGSYMAEALIQANKTAVIWAVIAIVLNIIVLDQILFRPLVCWVNKFKYEENTTSRKPYSWFYNVITNSYSSRIFFAIWHSLVHIVVYDLSFVMIKTRLFSWNINIKIKCIIQRIWYIIVIILCGYYGIKLWNYLPKIDLTYIPTFMLLTTLRVFSAMILSIIIFVPLGVFIALNHRVLSFCQPIIQILAALPVNLFYPLIAIFLISTNQSLGLWSIFLIMLGTQWYILFNVVAGVSSIPNHLLEVSQLFKLKGTLWWRKFMIPVIFPYIITGVITAAGGAWNASVVSEFINWGKNSLQTSGIGSYIAIGTATHNLPQTALGCTLMCAIVGLCIVFIWNPLYKLAETKYRVD